MEVHQNSHLMKDIFIPRTTDITDNLTPLPKFEETVGTSPRAVTGRGGVVPGEGLKKLRPLPPWRDPRD